METDARSFHVALVADELVNPSTEGYDALAVLEELDWGAIQLPARWYPDAVAAPLLEQVAEQAHELRADGYDLVLVGDRPGLEPALHALGVPVPDSVPAADAAELRRALSARKVTRPV
jgi:hypothetical protein